MRNPLDHIESLLEEMEQFRKINILNLTKHNVENVVRLLNTIRKIYLEAEDPASEAKSLVQVNILMNTVLSILKPKLAIQKTPPWVAVLTRIIETWVQEIPPTIMKLSAEEKAKFNVGEFILDEEKDQPLSALVAAEAEVMDQKQEDSEGEEIEEKRKKPRQLDLSLDLLPPLLSFGYPQAAMKKIFNFFQAIDGDWVDEGSSAESCTIFKTSQQIMLGFETVCCSVSEIGPIKEHAEISFDEKLAKFLESNQQRMSTDKSIWNAAIRNAIFYPELCGPLLGRICLPLLQLYGSDHFVEKFIQKLNETRQTTREKEEWSKGWVILFSKKAQNLCAEIKKKPDSARQTILNEFNLKEIALIPKDMLESCFQLREGGINIFPSVILNLIHEYCCTVERYEILRPEPVFTMS